MYKTNYFKNVELSSVKSIISSLKSSARTLKSENEEVAHLFMNSTEWEGEAKNTLQKGFDNVGARIDILQTKLDLFVDVLNSAMNVVELQNEMENSTDIEKLLANASMIETYMNQIRTLVSSIKAAGGGIETVVSSSSSFTSTDGFGTGIFQVNKEKFAIAKEDYNDWSNLFKVNYDSFLSTEASLSKDEYLYYAWGLLCISFDHLAVKRDHIENWLEGFLVNIKAIEASLPEKVTPITKVSTNKYAKTHEYPSKPSYESYLKSGRGAEIEEKKETSSSSSPSTNNSTNSNSYTPSSGGGNNPTTTSDNNTKKTDTSGSYATNYKGKSDYEKAKESATKKKTDTSGSYATNYKGKSDYEKAKESSKKASIGNPHGNVIRGNPNQTISSSTTNNKDDEKNKTSTTSSLKTNVDATKKWYKRTFGIGK